MTVEYLVNKVLNGSGDSDQHLMTLFSIALSCKGKNYVELGTRNGDTTLPLLMAAKLNGGILQSVDINQTPFSCPKEYENHWIFQKSDSILFLENWNPQIDIDFIYIDDWHSYDHVKKELEILDTLISPKTIILLHDTMYGGTEPYYHCDLTDNAGKQWDKGGPYRAIAELNSQFFEFATIPINNGLTLLRKKYSSKYKR